MKLSTCVRIRRTRIMLSHSTPERTVMLQYASRMECWNIRIGVVERDLALVDPQDRG